MKLTRFIAVVVGAALLVLPLVTGNVAALDVPPVPKDIPIVDQAGVLNPEQEQALAQKIAAERTQTGNQLGVLTVKSLQGDSLEDYSLRVAREWGIGAKERDSGVLLLVAVDDRQLRIEVGYGLEGALPDIRANRIIEERMKPSFRQGNYAAGISSGVDGILLAVHNERDPVISTGTQQPQKKESKTPWGFILMALLVIPTWLTAILARTKSWWAGGVLGLIIAGVIVALIGLTIVGIVVLVILPLIGLLFDKAVSKNYRDRASNGIAPSWWAGGATLGGGGNGSGGFGGFGGGGFGGGGSSGDW